MAESAPQLRDLPRADAYRELLPMIESVLDGVDDEIAAMATISSMLHHALGFLWTGFYRVVVPGKLIRVGPYQGILGCLEMEFGRGVCGTCAQTGEPVIVDDVTTYPNHITCDPRSRSEIVMPVFDGKGELIAVLDIDSESPADFSDEDRAGLEPIVGWFAKALLVRH